MPRNAYTVWTTLHALTVCLLVAACIHVCRSDADAVDKQKTGAAGVIIQVQAALRSCVSVSVCAWLWLGSLFLQPPAHVTAAWSCNDPLLPVAGMRSAGSWLRIYGVSKASPLG
jgi:hypothetical protein